MDMPTGMEKAINRMGGMKVEWIGGVVAGF